MVNTIVNPKVDSDFLQLISLGFCLYRSQLVGNTDQFIYQLNINNDNYIQILITYITYNDDIQVDYLAVVSAHGTDTWIPAATTLDELLNNIMTEASK